MLTGDDTFAEDGEADPGQGQTSEEAPAPEQETPSPDNGNDFSVWEDRYNNLHSRFGEQGNELGSLRQELAANKQELAEQRSWREEQDRAKGLDKSEVEHRLQKFIQDPDRYIESRLADRLTPLQKQAEEFKAWQQSQREQSIVGMVEGFKKEFPDSTKYANEINEQLQHIPREHLTKRMLKSAYNAARYEAGERAEESARKKAEVLTRKAALPKGVGASGGGNAPARKARNFGEAVSIAKSKAEAGG